MRVWMGNASDLPLGVTENLYLTLPRGWHSKLNARLTVKDRLFAPIRYGQKVGILALDIDRQPLTEYPLVALREINYGNFFQRGWDEVLLWLQ